jgi:hypothetical protein
VHAEGIQRKGKGVAAKPFDQKHHAHLPDKKKPPDASGGELQVFSFSRTSA